MSDKCLSRHLDIGCGNIPRNPLNAEELFGIDIRGADLALSNVKAWDAIREPIPYPDDYFSSVSCFDFLEHVPRIIYESTGETRFVFVELMQEIYRVLAPNGILLAASPYYPLHEAFSDPTHVNYLTKSSHLYFCGDSPLARMYGFSGRFSAELVERGLPKVLYHSDIGFFGRALLRIHRRLKGERVPHLLWKLRVVK